MTPRSWLRRVAPWWDKFDTIFTVILLGVVTVGYGSFVLSRPEPGLAKLLPAFAEFLKNSGILALLTAWTAIIALYRLRHRPNKIRPTVREDFDERDGETDFGLRNYGPGPALYIQALVTVGVKDGTEKVAHFQVHDRPLHLSEGEFMSLARDAEWGWVEEMAKEYKIGESGDGNEEESRQSPMVNLHFSYVSRSGAREPTHMSTEGDNEDVFEISNRGDTGEGSSKSVQKSSKPRHIELRRVVEECRTSS